MGFFYEKLHQLPLRHMKITAYASLPDGTPILNFQNFIVETFFLLFQQHSHHSFIIITDKNPEYSFPANTEVIIKPRPENGFLKKLWWDVKLPAYLKKLKTNLFISFSDVCSLTASTPQIIVAGDAEKIKTAYFKKAKLLIVNSESLKMQLISKHSLSGEKVAVIYPSADKNYRIINAEEKELIKNQFSDGREYFLYNSSLSKNEEFIDLLKSFSHFKKRQQSSFKLLLLTESGTFFEKSLSGYKYRSDVKFISTKNKNDQAIITAASYAVVLPFNANDDLITVLNAMQAGVPVIASKNSVINEVAEDAALYTESETTKDIGEKMIQLYTDEDHRSSLIKKGIDRAAKFSQEKAAELLWQAINSALE